jgi:sec-independent protein translocase protein TatA
MGRTLFLGEIIGPDILIILAIVMVLFGSTKIPKLARSLGQASHEFRKGLGEGVTEQLLTPPVQPASPPATPALAEAPAAAEAPAPAAAPAPAEPAKASDPAAVPETAPAPEPAPPAHPSPTGNSN